MPFFVRAINRENWPEAGDCAKVDDLDADALNDLKTSENTLSVWIANTKEDVDTAILAYLASMDKWVSLEMVEFIAIDVKDIADAGIEVVECPNFTYISEYACLHRDFVKLKYTSIEKLADIVIKSIEKGNDYVVDQGKIRSLFTDVVSKGMLQSISIDKGRHKKLKKMICEIEDELIN